MSGTIFSRYSFKCDLVTYLLLFRSHFCADQVLHLRIKRAPGSNRRCAFPVCAAKQGLKNLLQADRSYIARYCKIYVPPISRVCSVHANKLLWRNSDVTNESNDFTKENIEDMFQLLTDVRSIDNVTPLVLSKF